MFEMTAIFDETIRSMKNHQTLLTLLCVLITGSSVQADDLSQADRKRASYGFGYNLGKSYRADHMPMDLEQLFAGIRDGFQKKEPRISKKTYNRAITALNALSEQSRRDYVAEQGHLNKKKGLEFMALNGRRSGVKTLPSGLQVEVLKSGNPHGRRPDNMDLARVHYKGSTFDGNVFENTLNDEPVWLPVGGVIPGWSEALKMMRPGDKWRIVLPSKLGYGIEGNPPDIGPMCVLVFEVELFELKRIKTRKVRDLQKPRN